MVINERLLRLVQILIAILAAFFIVLIGRWHQLGEALRSPAFYIAVLISFLIAYLLLVIIHRGNEVLDRLFPWNRNLYLRAILQLSVGIILPTCINLLLAAIYIEATGQDFLSSGFLHTDFPTVLGFILLVNGYYLGNYFLYIPVEQHETVADDTQPNYMTISRNGQSISIDAKEDILYCCRLGRQVTIYTTDNNTYPIYQSLAVLLEEYGDAGFIQINRSTLINANIIAAYENGERRHTLQLYLKEEYQSIVTIQNQTHFVVTKEYMDSFLLIFESVF